MINLTTVQLRAILQLPERPFEDIFPYDGTPYEPLSHIEPCTVLQCSGTVASAGNLFVLGTDFRLTANCVDWTIPGGVKPDLNTPIYFDYTYSRLGGDAASTCVQNAQMIVAQDLGPAYPYGASSTSGVPFDMLATYGASLVAAREACWTLAATEIDLASKSRRGAVLLDDSKKTADWQASAMDWDKRYKRYLTMIRPSGMVRGLRIVGPNAERLIFGAIEREVFDELFINDAAEYGFAFGGIL